MHEARQPNVRFVRCRGTRAGILAASCFWLGLGRHAGQRGQACLPRNCAIFFACPTKTALKMPWNFITRFGETSLLLPCAVLIAAWLFHAGAAASARRWLIAFGATAAVVLVSKLAFLGWGIGCAAINFTGFSGHSMMSASVLPVLFYLVVPARHPRLAVGAGCLGLLFALLVGVSRLKLQAHSGSEVLSGLALGFGASLTFMLWSARPARSAPALAGALVLVLMLAVPAAGVAAPTHQWIEMFAARLAGRDKPYQRGQWREWAWQRDSAGLLACLPEARRER